MSKMSEYSSLIYTEYDIHKARDIIREQSKNHTLDEGQRAALRGCLETLCDIGKKLAERINTLSDDLENKH